MTPGKMKEAFEQCLAALVENAPYDMAIELTNTRKSKKGGPAGVGRGSTFSHLRWMCLAGCGFVDAGRLDKANRWLGFIQGALWSLGVTSIDEMKDWNRPTGDEHED
jgi:hypothetical protein